MRMFRSDLHKGLHIRTSSLINSNNRANTDALSSKVRKGRPGKSTLKSNSAKKLLIIRVSQGYIFHENVVLMFIGTNQSTDYNGASDA